MKAAGPAGAVVLLSNIIAAVRSIPEGLVALGVGLIGVALARWVFVNKEQRRVGRRESPKETLPLTLVAMLIAGVLIHDRSMGLSSAAFTGLGVGWAAVLLLDVLGDRVTTMLRAAFGVTAPGLPPAADLSGESGRMISGDVDIPQDMARLVDLTDRPRRGEDPDQ